MALSQIIKAKCPECGKDVTETGRLDFAGLKIIYLSCGHSTNQEIIHADVYEILSSDGKSLREYQKDGIKFVEEANFRALIADEQGLGKTVQGLGAIKLHRDVTLPAVIVTKTGLKRQWFTEIIRWCGLQGFIPQIIMSGKERALPGFDIYIITADLVKIEGMFDSVPELKTLVIDECQSIKNHESARAKAIQVFSKRFANIIALSGTPIKNHAGEYFTILNILKPERFSNYAKFLRDYCDHYSTMYGDKVGGIVDLERFKADTEDFVIRRTRKEAAPEIPEVDRQFFHVELDKKLNKAYQAGMQELDNLMYAEEDENTSMAIIAIMTKLRRITGLSKVEACIDYVSEFLINEPNRKLVIFAHHHDVVNILEAKLNEWLKDGDYGKCLNLHAGLSAEARADLVTRFKDDSQSRIMIASTLAAGEGLNLQFCSRAIMLERQWNPANEEQAEGRFARIGQEDNIVVTYMLASETIDEYFTELVEQKRAIVKNTLDGEAMQWDSNSLLKELAGVLLSKGKSKWKLV